MRNPFADSYHWSKRIWAPNPFVVLLRKAQTDLAIRIWTILVPIRSKKTEKTGFGPFSYKFFVCIRVGLSTRFSLSIEMSRLTRDGTAEPVSRDQILRHARGQGNIHFPCSADHEQDWQPYPVDPYSAICDDHTYIHTYIHTFKADSYGNEKLIRKCTKSVFVFCFFQSYGNENRPDS